MVKELVRKFSLILVICFTLVMTGCFEEEKPEENQTAQIILPQVEELKSVDYWLAHKQEMDDYWGANCRTSRSNRSDNCNVISAYNTMGENFARETYDSIKRQRGG